MLVQKLVRGRKTHEAEAATMEFASPIRPRMSWSAAAHGDRSQPVDAPEDYAFDERASALDPEMRKKELDVMGELAAVGMTTCVTHKMGFA